MRKSCGQLAVQRLALARRSAVSSSRLLIGARRPSTSAHPQVGSQQVGLQPRMEPLKGLILSGGAGYPAAPDHPHLGEAARARRQQARALLRDRGAGRRRGHRDRDHHRPGDRRGDPRGRRRRLRVRRRDHLHRPGQARRPRPRGADRGGVHRRLALRHVPRRQPPRRRPARPRLDLPRGRARRADPAHAGRRPAVLRRRRARRRADRAAGREAERPALEPRPGRRLPLQPADLRRRPLRSSPPGAASWRSPRRSRA